MVSAMTTPLPAARPSAFTTTGAPISASAACASSRLSATRAAAVGMPASVGNPLGEGLGRLELRAGLARAEDRHAERAQVIGEAVDQRRFRSDHHEVEFGGAVRARRPARSARRWPPFRHSRRRRTPRGRPAANGRALRTAHARVRPSPRSVRRRFGLATSWSLRSGGHNRLGLYSMNRLVRALGREKFTRIVR